MDEAKRSQHHRLAAHTSESCRALACMKPARSYARYDGRLPPRQHLGEPCRAVVLDASLAEIRASGVHRVKYAVALMVVDPSEGGGFNDEVVLCGPGFAVYRLLHSAATLANCIDRPKALESLEF